MPKRENLKLTGFTDLDREAEETVEYKQKITLTDYIRKDVKQDIKDIFEKLKEDRKPYEKEWDLEDEIYAGNIDPLEGQMFNVHYGIMAEKIDNAVNRADMAFFDGERIFDISPRPEFEREDGADIAQKQSDFLDYANEEVIRPREQCGLTFHSSFLHGLGWLFCSKKVIRQPRRERRVFQGQPIFLIPGEGGMMPVTEKDARAYEEQTGQQFTYVNKGLDEFLKAFPDYEGTGYAKKLHEGKEVKIVAEYDEIVYNDPHFENIDIRNIWTDPTVDSLYDLAKTKLIVHARDYSYWELKDLEEAGEFEDIDKLLYDFNTKSQKDEKRKNAENEIYRIYRCVYRGYVTEAKDKIEKFIVYLAEKKDIVIGCERFEFDRMSNEYLPFIVKKKYKGLYQPGLGKDLIDDNITLDLYTNFTLQMLYLHSVVTPVCEIDSPTYKQFHEKTFVHGRPLEKGKTDTIDFLNNHMKYPDVNSILAIMNKVEQRSGEKSHITHGMTGKESPTDPSAPASKTLALLGEGNFNFKMYINTLAHSFNEIAYMELAIYHQMEKSNVKYRKKTREGNELFGEITRDELVARTEIQAQALAFAVDRLNEKRENIALYSVIRPELRDFEHITYLDRMLIKSWSNKWRANVDKIMPTAEQAQQMKAGVAKQAVEQFAVETIKQAQISGQPPQIDPNALIQSVDQALADLASPPDEKELKRRQRIEQE